MSNTRIVYRPREDASAEAELSALANIYRYALKSKATGLTHTNGTSARNTEEESNVGQRPD